jgi:hypothetical protein
MSKLIIKSGGHAGAEFVLKPGINSVGRHAENDIAISEPSISTFHCELNAADIGISVRDLDSTNGTFINGNRTAKGMLQNGDRLTLGDIDFAVELPEVEIALPEIRFEEAAAAAFLDDGTPACFTHRENAALYRCSKCENWWCGECVRQLKRLSGDFLQFCPECSAGCVAIPRQTAASRKSFFKRIGDTLRISRKK